MKADLSIEERLAAVPKYTRFVTVDELYARAKSVAEARPDIAKLAYVGNLRPAAIYRWFPSATGP